MASSGASAWLLDTSRNVYYYDTPVEGGWRRVYQDNYSYFIPASPDYATTEYSASYAPSQASSAQDPRTAYHVSQSSLQGQAPYRDRTQSDASENYGYTIDSLTSATGHLQLNQESPVEHPSTQEGRPYNPQDYYRYADPRYRPSGHSAPTATLSQSPNPNYLQELASPKGATKQYLRGSNAEFKDDKLDSAFRRRKNGFFKVGKVFKAPWPEIAGYVNPNSPPTLVSEIAYGERVHTKIRWFVVVKTGNLSCSCLPIQTYRGKGASGSHLKKSHHAIIYTGDVPPPPDPAEAPPPGEAPLGTPIKVNPRKATDKLDPMSRVNFSKVYPVEHNVKVYDFGQVQHPQSEAWLLYQFKSIFDLSDLPSTAPLEEADEESSESEEEEETGEAVVEPAVTYFQGKGKNIDYE